jgi:hypothetical protein
MDLNYILHERGERRSVSFSLVAQWIMEWSDERWIGFF